MKASDIMTSPVITVGPEATAEQIAALLLERRISGVPVLEEGRLAGVVSEVDLLAPDAPGARARDIMTPEVKTAFPDTPVAEIAALLETSGIRRVPVVHQGRLVGIVTRANLLQALAAKARPAPTAGDDAAIRNALLAELGRHEWWRRATANVIVDDGIVHYWGNFDAEEQRQAARAAAQRVRGVRGVEDHRVRMLRPSPAPAPDRAATGIRRAAERGHSKYGRIDSWHSFSHGEYYDPAHMGFGPLRAINEICIAPGAGGTTYGLQDVEIITCVLEGALVYEDSLDNRWTLVPGEVQRISAGSGMRCSERHDLHPGPTRALQIWIEPARCGAAPECEKRRPDVDRSRGRLRVIASPDARESSLPIGQDVVVYAGRLDGSDRAELEIRPGRSGYVHVARGAIAANGEALRAGDGLRSGAQISLEGGEAAEVLVFDLPEGSEVHWRRRDPYDRRAGGAARLAGRRQADMSKSGTMVPPA